MTQPKFAPIQYEDEVRPSYRLAPPSRWTADRPADFKPGPRPSSAGSGIPGPDQGYVLLLAERIADRILLAPGEHVDDVIDGAAAIALGRAAVFGRAPVLVDLEFALRLFGYLSKAPEELVRLRRSLFDGLADDYWRRRELAHTVPQSLLRLSPAEVDQKTGTWRTITDE